MATIKFLLQSKSDPASIYLRLSLGRDLTKSTKDKTIYVSHKRKTGLFISPKDWSNATGLPKQTTADNKNLSTALNDLSNYVIQKLNYANNNSIVVNGAWLQNTIDVHFKRTTESNQSDLVIDAIQEIIDNADIRKNGTGGVGLSTSRINSYKSLKKMLVEYQGLKSYKIKEVNVKFANDFLKHLLNTKKYQKSYALKKIADLKTVCYDAETNGIEVNAQLKKIESSKSKNENIIYLSTQELDEIEKANIVSDALQNARKWLLLGCNIGQRGGDLLNLNENNFVTRNGLKVIELKQQKTGKNVTIPVLPKTQEILETGLPYKISIQKFNEHIKEVCKIAKINQMVKGGKVEVTTKGKGNTHKRKIEGIFPKYELIGSHVCRRSFSTNLYGTNFPTALIMQITAHSSEKMFLNYIGKDSLDYAQQIADFYTLQAQKEKRESNLTVVKQASNN